jgi:hypothetical protein
LLEGRELREGAEGGREPKAKTQHAMGKPKVNRKVGRRTKNIVPANDLVRLAPASEVAGGHAIKCFKIGRQCPF